MALPKNSVMPPEVIRSLVVFDVLNIKGILPEVPIAKLLLEGLAAFE